MMRINGLVYRGGSNVEAVSRGLLMDSYIQEEEI